VTNLPRFICRHCNKTNYGFREIQSQGNHSTSDVAKKQRLKINKARSQCDRMGRVVAILGELSQFWALFCNFRLLLQFWAFNFAIWGFIFAILGFFFQFWALFFQFLAFL